MDNEKLVSSGEVLNALREEDEHLSFLRRNVQIRHILTFMGFLSFTIMNMSKVNMSMGLVCMVDWYYLPNYANESCTYKSSYREDGEFGIQTDMQGHILAGYFYGMLGFQYIGVMLAERMRTKYILPIGILISSTCTTVIPVVAHFQGGLYMIFLQILKGAAHALILPAFGVLMGKWIPRSERFYSMCLIGSGIPFGAFLGTYASGVICRASNLGWTYIFYIFGGIGLIWCLFWLVMIYESPLTHPYITYHEMLRILRSQVIVPQAPASVPYKFILKSLPVWAYVVVGFVSFWALAIYTTLIPIFLHTILKFKIEMTGVFASLPYVAEMIFFLFFCVLNDRLNKVGRVRDINIHKWSIGFGLLGFGICILTVPFTGCSRVLTVTFLAMALGFCGVIFVSTSYIPLQLTPHFSGHIAAIMNTFGALAGIIVPTVMGYVTKERRSMHEWQILFYVTSALSFLALVVFLIFGASSVQEWDNPEFHGSRTQVLEVEVETTPQGQISVVLVEPEQEESKP